MVIYKLMMQEEIENIESSLLHNKFRKFELS